MRIFFEISSIPDSSGNRAIVARADMFPPEALPSEITFIEKTEADLQPPHPGYRMESVDVEGNINWISPPTPLLEDVKKSFCSRLLSNMNAFIATEPDGSVRYDQNFTNTALQYAIAHGLTTDPLPALNAWRGAIGAFYFETHAAILAASTVEEVQAIDISVASFEAKFGVSGTITADPNITTQQLMA